MEEMEDDDRDMSNHTPQSNVTTCVQDNQQQDIHKFLIMSQLEAPKRKRLSHPILDYSKSIIWHVRSTNKLWKKK